MREHRIAAIDLGSSYVRAAILQINSPESVDVIGFGESPSAGIEEGGIVDIHLASSSVSEALRQVQRSSGLTVRRAVIGVNGGQLASLNARGIAPITRSTRRITKDDLLRSRDQTKIIVLPPDREIIQCIPRSYRVDGQQRVTSPLGMFGSRLEMDAHIVTGSVTQLLNCRQCVLDAACGVAYLIFNAIASAISVLSPEEKQNGAISINIGGGTTGVAIFKEGCLTYSSVFPLGGIHITRDISQHFRMTFEEAERQKLIVSRRIGCDGNEPSGTMDKGASEIRSLIASRVDEIVHNVKQEIVKSGCYKLLPAGIVLSGGSAAISGLSERFETLLRMPARIGVSSCGRNSVQSSLTEYATAIGIGMFDAAREEGSKEGVVDKADPTVLVERFLDRFRTKK